MNYKVAVEADNRFTDIEREKILQERKIDIIPDIMVNSGDVIVSYFK